MSLNGKTEYVCIIHNLPSTHKGMLKLFFSFFFFPFFLCNHPAGTDRKGTGTARRTLETCQGSKKVGIGHLLPLCWKFGKKQFSATASLPAGTGWLGSGNLGGARRHAAFLQEGVRPAFIPSLIHYYYCGKKRKKKTLKVLSFIIIGSLEPNVTSSDVPPYLSNYPYVPLLIYVCMYCMIYPGMHAFILSKRVKKRAWIN